MGTNVYAIRENPFPESEWVSDYTDRVSQYRIHIGKRSAGWKFQFNSNNWKYYDYRLETIIDFLSSCYRIVDEYDREMDVDDFVRDFVLFNPTGFDGESYAKYELNCAKLKAAGHPNHQSQFIPDINLAKSYYDNCKNRNWYMTTTYNGIEIPKELPYYFSDSTEFS